MTRLAPIVAMVLLVAMISASPAAESPFLPARDPAPLLAAIEAERPAFAPPEGVTGISVPHHLLAADLIARGFWAASAGHYDRIIIISPDHFRRASKPFATTRAALDTVLGVLAPDVGAIDALAQSELVEMLPDLTAEHGVMAVAPFVAHFFPDAEVVPIIAAITSNEGDWSAMAELLRPLLTPETLLVQSTDYSHYRTAAEAVMRDQETMAVIASRDPGQVNGLLQPAHMDSKAAQYIQMRAQRDVFDASPVILANRNSVAYGTSAGSTTSYVVTAWLQDPRDGSVFQYGDQQRTMFAGDTLLGRYFLPALRNPDSWTLLRDTVREVTGGMPMVVNFEGVLLDRAVTGLGFDAHLMVRDDAEPILNALNVTAASLANNHANDLGPEGLAETLTQLDRIGIRALQHGEVSDMGSYRLLPINFVGGKLVGGAIADAGDLDFVCGLHAAPPLVALVHWGTEYVADASDEERAIADALARCGVSLVIGGHSHQGSDEIELRRGGALQMVYSLGNFIFDQSAPRGSGTLLELRAFEQGTVAARLIAMPNLFDLTRPAN